MPRDRLLRCCDNTMEAALLGLVGWFAAAYGGVLPLSELALGLVGATCAAVAAVRVWIGGAACYGGWLAAAAFAVAAFIGLQSVSLPSSLLAAIAPSTAAMWSAQVLSPPLAGGAPAGLPLTLYPDATEAGAPVVLACAVLFVVALQLYRDAARVRRLCVMVVLAAAVLAAQRIASNLFGVAAPIVELDDQVPLCGPFVSYSHFAAFTNLGIGCAFALLLSRMAHRSGSIRHHVPALLADLRRPGRAVDVALLLATVALMFAVAVSRSRMGVVATCAGGVALSCVLQRTGALRGTGWLLGLLVVSTLVALMFGGFDEVYRRVASAAQPDGGLDGRVALFRDSAAMAGAFPLFGVGHGAYELVFPLFDESARGGRAQHAENVYVELFAEVGAVGAALELGFVALVGAAWWRRLRRLERSADLSAAGLLFGVVAVLVHGVTDFGLRVPAVGVTTLLCAAAATASCAAPVTRRLGRLLFGVVCAAASLVLLSCLPSLWRAHAADAAWRQAEALATPRAAEVDAAALARRVQLVDVAVQLRPGHAEYLLRRAALGWQLASAEQFADLEPGQPIPAAALATLREAAQVAQARALAARRAAPTYGLLWSLAGQLGAGWLGQPEAGEWIIRGMDMSPESPAACLAAGGYLLGRDDVRAAAAFARAVQVGAKSDEVLGTLLDEAQRPDVAAAVAFDDVELLVALLPRLSREPDWSTVALDVRARTVELLEERAAAPDAPARLLEVLARLLLEDGDRSRGLALLRRVLRVAPSSRLRLELVEQLEQSGDFEEARREVERYLLHHPGDPRAARLLDDLRGR